MPEYLAPGVYVEEIEIGPKPIEGVSTSTAGFLGETERGPTDPRLLTSAADYARLYGGFKLHAEGERLASSYLGYAVDGFFRNGGKRCFVGRIEAESEAASVDLRANEEPGPTPRVDFGSVVENRQATEILRLTNRTGDPIAFDAAEVSASGFDGRVSATQLDPGEATSVEMTYQAGADRAEETLTIPYGPADGAERRNLVVELLGEGTQGLAANALAVDFEAEPVGSDGAQRRVRLTNRSNENVTVGDDIDSVDPNDDTVAVEAFGGDVEARELGPGGSTDLVVTFAPQPTDSGTVEASLRVPYERPAGADTLVLDLSGDAGPALAASAPWLDFGRVEPAGATTDPQPLRLTNRSNAELEVTGVDVVDQAGDPVDRFGVDGIAVGDTLAGGERGTADVTFTPADEGRVAATLQIAYELDGTGVGQPLEVGLFGQGPAPLEVDALRATFEPVPFGTAGELSFRLHNRSGADVTIQEGNVVVNDDGGNAIGAFAAEFEAPALADDEQTTLALTLNASALTPTDVQAVRGHLVIPYTVDGAPDQPDPLTVTVTADVEEALDVVTSVVVGTAAAVGPGIWGRNVVVLLEAGSQYTDDNPVFRMRIRYWARDEDVALARERGPFSESRDAPAPTPDAEEIFDNLSLSDSSTSYFVTQVNAGSTLVEVSREGAATPERWDVEPLWLDGQFTLPVEAATLGHYEGSDAPGQRTGLAAFGEIDEIAILSAPNENDVEGLTDALVGHCETMGDRFAVLQSSQYADGPATLSPGVTSSYAAFYYPWLEVVDPATSIRKQVPPGGHVAGIYARSDVEHGVHKAPANEVVRGVSALQFTVTKGEQDLLNPRGVNVIRSFKGRGIRVWGARTTSSDPAWKYVNVRRLFLFLEESIDEGTQWVVFEPNSERLWARVRQTLSGFLTTVWRDGALMGTTPEEAYFVKCDRSTMTQTDIDNGRLIAVIGVAPVKPAEFVIFRIAQWTGGAEGA